MHPVSCRWLVDGEHEKEQTLMDVTVLSSQKKTGNQALNVILEQFPGCDMEILLEGLLDILRLNLYSPFTDHL